MRERGLCPVCAEIVWEEELDFLETLPARGARLEKLCSEHLRTRHPVRFWLWRRFHWRLLLHVEVG